jgi:CHAT domain-containing protein/tetratricopeptide (TPR) repeat protein
MTMYGHSYSKSTSFTCPSCGQDYQADVWMIVDTAEQPNLAERTHPGTVHHLACPHCGHQVGVDATLRHYQAGAPRAASGSGPGTNEPQPEAYRTGGTLGLCLRIRLLITVERTSRRLNQVFKGIGGRLTKFGDRLIEISDRLAETGEASGPIDAPIDLAAFQREWLHMPNNPAKIPQFIERWQLWLPIVERGSDPALRAKVHYVLADAFTKTPEGERADNLERALEHYTQAQEAYTRQADPEGWAGTQYDLGTAYANRIHGVRADNLERAIEHYDQALEVYTRQANPAERAATLHNLAGACLDRIRGEQTDNLELAIEYCRQALEIRSRQAGPEDWAMTQYSLGRAYRRRIHGERADNLERAIEHYTWALEVYTRKADPEHWAATQNALANVYADRIRGKRADNLELAIEHYTQALEVYTPKAYPEDWAMIQHNLGNAYRHRIHGERAANLELAIAYYTRALDVYSRQTNAEGWAWTHNNLGLAYTDRICGQRAGNLKRAIHCFNQALEVYALKQFPASRLQTTRNLGDLHFDIQNWKEAHRAYEGAIEAGDLLLDAAYTEAGRQAEVAETSRLYARAAYALLRLQRPPEALHRLEQGKTRLLSEALALADADVAMLPEAQQRHMLEAQRNVRELEAEMRLPPDTPARRDDRELATLLHQARVDLGDLVAAIRHDHPDFLPAGLDLPDILALIPLRGALVAPLLTSQGSAVFVLPQGAQTVEAQHVITLEGFGDADLRELLLGPEDDPHSAGWMGAYFGFRFGKTGAFFEAWHAAIEAVTHRLWDALMGPVHDRLQELGLAQDAPVILMPQGGLGLLPLHAAWREFDGATRTFLDDHTVHYAPSAHALSVAQRRLREPQRHGTSLLSVVNPTGDLRHAPAEGRAVAAHFELGEQHVLVGDRATQEAVVGQARGRSYLHFSCHGFYRWLEPMASGLWLAGSDPNSPPDPFELREILSPRFDLSASRLVALSACETGLTDYRQSPDEYLGLPTGFLQAGAPAVVSTLWPVDDLSTALLMGEFYHRHLDEGQGIAEALRDAQLWLRNLERDEVLDLIEPLWEQAQQEDPALFRAIDPLYWQLLQGSDEYDHPFAHPYYWGAFTASGALS